MRMNPPVQRFEEGNKKAELKSIFIPKNLQEENMELRVVIPEEEDPPSEATLAPLADSIEDDNLFGRANFIQKFWPHVTQEEWNDWKWQMANRVRTIEELALLLNLKPYQITKFKTLIKTFRYSITPYYLSLIDWYNPEDPVKKQCIPDLRELEFQIVGDGDPLEEEQDSQVPGLVHRYPDRVLAVVTNTCSMYCRHCTRKRIWHEGESLRTRHELSNMVHYIQATPEVREVIVSGGDPLTMNLDLLDWFLDELQRISHIEVLRIGTRVPVVLPMRITDELCKMLAKHRPLWVNTQFNHPREVTAVARAASDRLVQAGVVLGNQAVLLKGINNHPFIMRKLNQELLKIRVRPYYIFHAKPVKGTAHFITSIAEGMEIMEQLRGYTSGLAVPTYIVNAPHGLGKTPILPQYILARNDRQVVLRTWEKRTLFYPDTGHRDDEQPAGA